MPEVTTFDKMADLIQFGKDAAAAFAKDAKMYSFSYKDIGDTHRNGEYLALRWGWHERAVLVLKLDAEFTPVIFGDAVQREGDQ